MTKIACLCVVLFACGNKDNQPAKSDPAPAAEGASKPEPVKAAAATAPSPLPPAKDYMSAGALPKELSGQLMRDGKLVDVTTLGAWTVMTGCDDIAGHGGDMVLNDAKSKAILLLHMNSGIKLGQPLELAAKDRVLATTWVMGAGDTRMVYAIGGTLVAHKLSGEIDLEVEADFGADGKIHARLVTGAPAGKCGSN
jgi:hypothetical protein